MSQKPRFGIPDLSLLLLTLAVAVGVRAAYLLGPASDGPPLRVQTEPPVLLATDTELLDQSPAPLAARPERTAHTSPGYPWLLTMLTRVVSESRLNAYARWLNCALGALAAGLYFLFAHFAFRSRLVATLAGLFCALHPYWVVNTAALNDGTLTAFLLGLTLYLGAQASRTGGAFASLLYGLALAALALVRAPLLPFAFAALLWFLLRSRRIERGWLCALLAFLGFANGLALWTLRNYRAFHEPVPVVDSAYLHLWMGNNRLSDGGPQPEGVVLGTLALRRDTSPQELREELAGMKQPRRYRSLSGDVLGEIREHPDAFLRHRIQAGEAFLYGADWLRGRRVVEATGGGSDLPAWLAGSYEPVLLAVLLLMLLLALVGWRWTYPWRHEAMPSSLALVCVPLPYLLAHAGALHGARMPLDGVLLTYAAFALACCLPGIGRDLLDGARGEDRPPEDYR